MISDDRELLSTRLEGKMIVCMILFWLMVHQSNGCDGFVLGMVMEFVSRYYLKDVVYNFIFTYCKCHSHA